MATIEKEKALAVVRLMVADGQVSQEVAEKYFPELKESEGERMVKFIKKQLFNIKKTITENYELDAKLTKAIDWLEKQGQTFTKKPKFKVGDWVVYECGEDSATLQIKNIVYGTYEFTDDSTLNVVDEDTLRLWDITKDAKPGDVLADGNLPFIFKKIDTNKYSYAYCGISVDDGFKIESDGKSGEWTWMQDIKPATKEQRDLLFQKMKEAGYEWDAEKKKLKEIEEEVDGEDYGIDSLYHAQRILEKTLGSVDGYQSDDGILEHKCAISAVKKLYEQKPEWGEEDEKQARQIERIVHDDGCTQKLQKQIADWFKSLKGRVQPKVKWSEEDEKKFSDILAILKSGENCYYNSPTLIDWFKSFRSQNAWKPSDLPHWEKSTLPNDNTTGFNSDYFCHNGYCINYKELFEKLPKD